MKQKLNYLAILTITSLSFFGSQIPNIARANQSSPSVKQTNQFLLAQQQQVCQLQSSPADNRRGVDFRDQPGGGKNIAFFNDGTPVTIINKSNDGQWSQVTGPNNTQGWVYTPYLKNCNNQQLPDTGNRTGGIPIGSMCQAVGSPNYPNIPVQDFPNPRSNRMPYAFEKGTQLQVIQPPPGQQSKSKWVYVKSTANPRQVGWVWKPYIQCN
ncbi:MAG: SH3 domain-containing protein [Trichodesmium sp.]